MVEFDRPLGAAADLKEIEYVSALHQTQSDASREDGSVKDVDIKRFLRSRYGIEIGIEDVRRTVLGGLGGGDDHEETIDLAELVAVILIPSLLKMAASTLAADGGKDLSSDSGGGDGGDDDDRAALTRDLQPDPAVLGDVLSMILGDATGSTEPPRLTRSLLGDILRTYGEGELADDDVLLGEMLAAAGGENGTDEGAVILDTKTFAKALTADVRLYDVDNETRMSTNFDDILFAADRRECLGEGVSGGGSHDNGGGNDDGSDEFEDERKAMHDGDRSKLVSAFEQSANAKLMRDAPSIDFVAGRYRSKLIATLLFVGFIISYFAYFYGKPIVQTPNLCPGISGVGGFFCKIANAVLDWIIILINLMGVGMLYVGTGSLGNNIESKKKWHILIGIFFVLCYTAGFYATYQNSGAASLENEIGPLLALIVGFAIIFLQICLLVEGPVRKCSRSERVRAFFTPGSIKAESRTKQAAVRKINAMIRNAITVHGLDDGSKLGSSFGKGIHNFAVIGDSYEMVGGFMWTWRRIFNGQLFSHEGVWISARVLAGNTGQFLISLAILFLGGFLTQQVLNAWRTGIDNKDTFVEWSLATLGVHLRGMIEKNVALFEDDYNGMTALVYDFLSFDNSGQTCEATFDVINYHYGDPSINTGSLCGLMRFAASRQMFNVEPIAAHYLDNAKNSINSFVSSVNEELYPQEEYMVAIPMIATVVIAFLFCLALVSLYVPSVVSATLQFRSGAIPLFRDPKSFELHRSGIDVVTLLLGSMFWSALYAAILSGIGVGIVLFIFLWQATRDVVINITAQLIGLAITISIKMVLVLILVRSTYAGYYRQRPGRANIGSLAIECANIAFSVGTALARAAKIIVITAMYIGRIDTPLLAPGVGIGPLTDMYPTIFRKDVLAHDAHRHPFLEILGTMYMMKVRYASSFGSKAGYCYRLIFTIALMPWLRKYRIMTRPELQEDEEYASENTGSGLLLTKMPVPHKLSTRPDPIVPVFMDESIPAQMQRCSLEVGRPMQSVPIMVNNEGGLETTIGSPSEMRALEQRLLVKDAETAQLRSEIEQLRRELETAKSQSVDTLNI